jgi:hypothetical protein
MSLINKIQISCKEATLLICKEQDKAISFREKVQLKIHLFICSICTLFYKQSNLLHHHFTKMNPEYNHSNTLQLDEMEKALLQEKLDAELKK